MVTTQPMPKVIEFPFPIQVANRPHSLIWVDESKKIVALAELNRNMAKRIAPKLHAPTAILLFAKLIGSKAAKEIAPHLFLPISPVKGKRPTRPEFVQLQLVAEGRRSDFSCDELVSGDAHREMRNIVIDYAAENRMRSEGTSDLAPGHLLLGGAVRVEDRGQSLTVAYNRREDVVYWDREEMSLALLLEQAPYVLSDLLAAYADARYRFTDILPVTLSNQWRRGNELPAVPANKVNSSWQPIELAPIEAEELLDDENSVSDPIESANDQRPTVMENPVEAKSHGAISNPATPSLAELRALRLARLLELSEDLKQPIDESAPELRTQVRILAALLPEFVTSLQAVTAPAKLRRAVESVEDVPEEIRSTIGDTAVSSAMKAKLEELRSKARQIIEEEIATARGTLEEERRKSESDKIELERLLEEIVVREEAQKAKEQELLALESRLNEWQRTAQEARTLLEQRCMGQAAELIARQMDRVQLTKKELKELATYHTFASRMGRKGTDVPSDRPELHRSKDSGRHGTHGKL